MTCCFTYILVVPVEIIQPVSEREQVPVDESFEIKCKTDFNSRVKWMFDETQELHDRIEGVSIVNVLDRDARIMMSVLRLEGATVENSGKYTCQNLKESGDKDSVEIEVGDGKSGEWIMPVLGLVTTHVGLSCGSWLVLMKHNMLI